MKASFGIRLFVSTVIALITISCRKTPVEPALKDIFFCRIVNNKPTIMARHHWGNVPVIKFGSRVFEKNGWSPQKRCEEISQRLDEFHAKGWLKHLSEEYIPKEGKLVRVICIAPYERPHLRFGETQIGLLMTLTQQDDGEAILTTLRSIATDPEVPPVLH